MARGWESKAVEDQQAAAEAEKLSRSKPAMNAQERERRATRDSLVLARLKLQKDLQSAKDDRYRAMLEQAIVDLERTIGAIE